MPYGMQSSDNLWTQSEEQPSNDFGYGQSRAILDPYYNCQHHIPQPITLTYMVGIYINICKITWGGII